MCARIVFTNYNVMLVTRYLLLIACCLLHVMLSYFYMTLDTQHIENFKNKLEEEKIKLEGELGQIGRKISEEDWMAIPEEQQGPAGNDDADANVQANYTEDFEERIGTLSVIEQRYAYVLRALKKIDAGTYGTFEVSGEVIELDRLEANPAARTNKAHMNDNVTE